MSVNLSIGAKVPLFLNVGDGNDNLHPIAIVKNDQGVLVGEFNLVGVGDGQYSYDGLIMPDVQYLNIIYKSYNDSNHTELAYYYIVTETFVAPAIDDTASDDKLTEAVEVALGDYNDEVEVIIERKPK
jgi:hypothetical protein